MFILFTFLAHTHFIVCCCRSTLTSLTILDRLFEVIGVNGLFIGVLSVWISDVFWCFGAFLLGFADC